MKNAVRGSAVLYQRRMPSSNWRERAARARAEREYGTFVDLYVPGLDDACESGRDPAGVGRSESVEVDPPAMRTGDVLVEDHLDENPGR